MSRMYLAIMSAWSWSQIGKAPLSRKVSEAGLKQVSESRHWFVLSSGCYQTLMLGVPSRITAVNPIFAAKLLDPAVVSSFFRAEEARCV